MYLIGHSKGERVELSLINFRKFAGEKYLFPPWLETHESRVFLDICRVLGSILTR